MFDSHSARYRRVQAYAYLRGIAGCICFRLAESSLIVVRLPLCAVSQGSSLCLSARYRRVQAYAYLRGIAGCICFRLAELSLIVVRLPLCAVSQAAYAYLRGIAGCTCFTFAELSLIVVRLPLCAVSQGSNLCLSARYRRLHMPICAVSQAAYAYLRGIAGCICFRFAELSLIVVRLPLCAVSQGSSLCLAARYRRLHMLQVCRIIFNRCSTPALRGIAGFKLMPICAVSQAAYAYLRGIAGCICFKFAELSLIVVRLPLCAVSQGSSICLAARYRRLHMLQVCRIIFNRCSTPALRGIAGFKLVPICAVLQAAYAYLRGIAGCICLSARYRRLHMLQVCRIIFNSCSTPTLRGIAGFKLMPSCAVSQAAYASGLPNYL